MAPFLIVYDHCELSYNYVENLRKYKVLQHKKTQILDKTDDLVELDQSIDFSLSTISNTQESNDNVEKEVGDHLEKSSVLHKWIVATKVVLSAPYYIIQFYLEFFRNEKCSEQLNLASSKLTQPSIFLDE